MYGSNVKKAHLGSVTSLSLGRDSDYIFSASWDYTIKMWNIKNISKSKFKLAKTYSYHIGPVLKILVTSFGSLVSASGDGSAAILDLDDNSLKYQYHDKGVSSIAVDVLEGLLLTGTYDGNVNIWDIYNEEKIMNLCGHNKLVSFVSFGSDQDEIQTASLDKRVNVWRKTGDNLNQDLIKSFNDGQNQI